MFEQERRVRAGRTLAYRSRPTGRRPKVVPALVGRRIVGVRLRAEDDAVVAARLLQRLVTQRRAVLLEAGKADILVVELESEAEFLVGGAQHAYRSVDDLGADAVTWQDKQFHDRYLVK